MRRAVGGQAGAQGLFQPAQPRDRLCQVRREGAAEAFQQ